jgi:pilus assembly protein CpaB
VPSGSFKEAKQVQDRVVKVGVLRGEPLLERKLAPVGTLGGLSAVIAEGKRAMTVRVNDVVGVAGFALPGNYVDVMVNAQQDKQKDKGEEGKQISKTVLERVLVLAVAQEAGRDDTKPKVVSAVTLELSPQDSEKLDLARSVGTLSLVLRNQIDQKSVATVGVTKNELFDAKQEAVVKLAVARKPRQAAAPAVLLTRPAHCVEVTQHGTSALACF